MNDHFHVELEDAKCLTPPVIKLVVPWEWSGIWYLQQLIS